MNNNIDKNPFDILSEGIKLVRDCNNDKNPDAVNITSKELIDIINRGIEKLEANTGIVPNTIIAPKSIIDRLSDIQKKAGQVKEWKGNREYRRKNKIK